MGRLQLTPGRALATAVGRIPLPAARRWAKRHEELAYWRSRLAAEGELRGTEYERFFTEWFGLTPADYEGKRVLDIGCGPRGSLDWAAMAAERVGLDPLADEYVRLRGGDTGMAFVSGVAEAIPFPDSHFDVVASFNSLDHVDDLGRAVAEITRVARSGAALLLVTDVGHEPTFTEPQAFSWEVLETFGAGWEVVDERRFLRVEDNMLKTLEAAIPFDPAQHAGAVGTLSARLRRR